MENEQESADRPGWMQRMTPAAFSREAAAMRWAFNTDFANEFVKAILSRQAKEHVSETALTNTTNDLCESAREVLTRADLLLVPQALVGDAIDQLDADPDPEPDTSWRQRHPHGLIIGYSYPQIIQIPFGQGNDALMPISIMIALPAEPTICEDGNGVPVPSVLELGRLADHHALLDSYQLDGKEISNARAKLDAVGEDGVRWIPTAIHPYGYTDANGGQAAPLFDKIIELSRRPEQRSTLESGDEPAAPGAPPRARKHQRRPVRVVDYRPHARPAPDDTEPGSSGRSWRLDHRVDVKGHKRTLRNPDGTTRQVDVKPHSRGPEDAAPDPRPRVYVARQPKPGTHDPEQ